jgi:enoyl-CoA hydratase/carnithine racemase
MTSPRGASPADVHLDTDRDVAVLTMDRPAKLNALTSEMTATLAGHVAALNADPAIAARR